MAIYVFFSFLFYVPVVLFKDTYPSLGTLMMPKTLMYVLIVAKLYKNLKKEFVKKDIMEFAVAYLFSGILAGAVYRELGKIYTLDVKMAFVHTHLIVLGFAVSAIFYLLVKRLDLANKTVEKFYKIYNYGIFLSFSTMFLHGLVDNNELLNSVKMTMVGFSGIGHILITLAVIVISVKGLRARQVVEAN